VGGPNIGKHAAAVTSNPEYTTLQTKNIKMGIYGDENTKDVKSSPGHWICRAEDNYVMHELTANYLSRPNLSENVLLW
jgi:hypothetical protein